VKNVKDDTAPSRSDSKSLITLLRELPGLLVALFKAELNQFKTELTRKLKYAGIGIGMFAVAALFGFFLLATLIAAAVLALALVFPPWLAALLTAAGLLILVVLFALVGMASLKKGMPPAPTETVESVKEDVEAIKGMGHYDQ
jgi:hypothetical protein